MARALTRALTVGALVLGVPAACLGGLLAYGKALADMEVAEGRLVTLTPEERQARAEEARRRFQAMNPAEHLATARRDLDRGYDRDLDIGGDYPSAKAHLDAVPEAAPEREEARRLLGEIERRKGRLFTAASLKLRAALRAHPEAAGTPEPRRRVLRVELAREVDRLAGQGLGCVHVDGDGATALRYDSGACDARMLDAVTDPESRAGLRSWGFRAVRCANARARIDL